VRNRNSARYCKALILFQITRNKKREVFIEELPETTVQQMGNQGWEGYFP